MRIENPEPVHRLNSFATPTPVIKELSVTLPPPRAAGQIVADIPTGRLGTPEEIAYGVGFLADEQASWITGSNLDINGGHHMGW